MKPPMPNLDNSDDEISFDETMDILDSHAGHREGGPREAQQKQFNSDFFNSFPDDAADESDMQPPPAPQ